MLKYLTLFCHSYYYLQYYWNEFILKIIYLLRGWEAFSSTDSLFKSKSGLGQAKPELETQYKSPTWVTRTQTPVLSLIPFRICISRRLKSGDRTGSQTQALCYVTARPNAHPWNKFPNQNVTTIHSQSSIVVFITKTYILKEKILMFIHSKNI